MSQPSFRSCYPMAGCPRRIVTNMLLMSAFKIGNPVQAFVLMKGDDFTRDSGDSCSHGFHMEITVILRPLTFDGGIHAGPSPAIRRQQGQPDYLLIRWFHAAAHFPILYSRRIIQA